VAQRRFELSHLDLDELMALWEDIDAILRYKAAELERELAQVEADGRKPRPKRRS
jgi:hypothetical protein